jgi:hypothetical protein
MASKTVFISAVSGGFREARESLTRELRKAGCDVMEQADFHLEPANPTLLGKLRAYLETKATNRGQEGEPLVRRALAIVEASLGPDHPRTGHIGANLADVLGRIGQVAETRERFRRALATLVAQVRAIGRAHPWHDEAERDYRAFLAAQGEAASAIDTEIAAVRSESGLPIGGP